MLQSSVRGVVQAVRNSVISLHDFFVVVFFFYSGSFWSQSSDNLESLMRMEVSFRCLAVCGSRSSVTPQIDVRPRVIAVCV